MSPRTNQQYWQEQLEQCQALALSGAAYCKQHNLSYYKFVYWRKRLSECGVDPQPRTVSRFVKVVPSQLAAAKLTLLLPSGISITGFDAGNIELLGAVLRQL